MMNLSKRDRNLLAFLIIVLLGAGFYFLSYAPTSKEITVLASANRDLQKEAIDLQTEINNAPPPAELDGKETIDNRLPNEDEMIPLMTMLDETLTKDKLPFKSFDYRGTDKVTDNGVWGMTFVITTTGKLIPLLDFINELENAERLISIENVSFSGVKAERDPELSEAEAGPPAYYIAPPGIPEGKLQRIKFEIVDAPDEIAADTEKPVAGTFELDVFDMRLTIKAYYTDIKKEVSDENINNHMDTDDSDAEGAV